MEKIEISELDLGITEAKISRQSVGQEEELISTITSEQEPKKRLTLNEAASAAHIGSHHSISSHKENQSGKKVQVVESKAEVSENFHNRFTDSIMTVASG